MQKRILYVGNDMRYFMLHRYALAVAARDEGYDIHAALPGGEGGGGLARAGIAWHKIPLKRGSMKPLQDVALMLALCRLYRMLSPDIIHHHTIKPVIFGGICARAVGCQRVVSSITGLGYTFVSRGVWANVRWRLVKAAYRFALGQSRASVIFQNRDDMASFLDAEIVSAGHAHLIKGSGVDLAKFGIVPEQPGRPTVVLVSRMLWNKGIGEFVDAAQQLKSSGCDARFLLVGDIDDTNPASISRQQMRAWHDSGVIEWAGWSDDMAQVYRSAHIVCLPSKYGEGVPRSLIEAAACGRPIVTTNSPGCREIVRDGENGYLVPIGDSRSIADALEKLIFNSELRRNMGLRGREIAEVEFSLDKVIRETLAVYDELLK